MVKRLIRLSLAIILLFILTGCNISGKHKIYEEGYLQYIIVGKNSRFPINKEEGIIAIVGLTESGIMQESLDIPKTIDGKEV